VAVLSGSHPGRLASVCMALALTGVAPAASFEIAAEPVSLEAVLRTPTGAERSRLDAEGMDLARRFAPAFSQDTSPENPERDRPLHLDFDGDWDAENNWSHLTPAALRSAPAVYASWILSETHAFLTYTLFYPRDWVASLCVPYVCHDNDLESALVVVERARPSGAAAELVLVETKFHWRYAAARASELARGQAGQPLLAVETEGHGMLPVRPGDSLGDHPLRLVERTAADSARGAERYDLLPLREALWARRAPSSPTARLWTPGEGGFLSYSGARLGPLGYPLGAAMAGREFPGGVRPPWAIGAEGARGDWFLDPAFVTLARHGAWFGERRSSVYVLNTYVDELAVECAGPVCSRARVESEASLLHPGSLLTGLGLLMLRPGRRPRRGSARDRPRLARR
jgi:hypothetical protein